MATQESNATEEDARDTECPVCYECFADTARTLSCGHVFCHDCLVKTLVSVSRDGQITRENIICPICRHLTFITKQSALVAAAVKDVGGGQTLQVPLSLPARTAPYSFDNGEGVSAHPAPPAHTGLSRVVQYFRWISTRLTRPQFKSRNNASQIFIITTQGRPMADDDEISVVTTTVSEQMPRRRQRRRICTTTRCLLILLSSFTVLTLIVASLPWILLS
ncbi:RING finger protein 222 [Megalops cyprinoides]|uniref:RING finger protein 222 n=1 Tax=Megalops cyprinoides TaxID=118141 RepID=UPI001863C7F2|nr:RING finger protein 222 [Megalops cyprinoides]